MHKVCERLLPTEVPQLIDILWICCICIILCSLFVLFNCAKAESKKTKLSEYEIFYRNIQSRRLLIMSIVPLFSLTYIYLIKDYSIVWASIIGGFSYSLYPLLIFLWSKNIKNKKNKLNLTEVSN